MTAQPAPLDFHAAPPRVSRRHALGLMAASMALASGACSRLPRGQIHPWVQMPEATVNGEPLYYATAVLREGHAMGVLVATHDGRPAKVEGNPLHPSSLGGTDIYAQAAVLQLWDPDRSASVMQRLGEADAARGAPLALSSWSAFDGAWRALGESLAARQGEGFRVLTGPTSSPTLRAQLHALIARYPKARWHQYSALPGHAQDEGALRACGAAVQPLLHLDRASCIVALGADPFSDGPGAVRHAADWASRRAAGRPCAAFAAEVAPGLFGARAGARIALAPAGIDALLRRVAQRLSGSAVEAPPDNAQLARFEAELQTALSASGPGALLIPGPALSAQSHALVHAIHDQLGARGRTVEWLAPLAREADTGSLQELVADMNAGSVHSLLILDANPVYDAPGALGFADALAKLRFTAHAGLYRGETALACQWHLPLSHTFEQWSDALAHDGTPTLIQPLIAPLYDTRCAHELLASMMQDGDREGMRIVQRFWRTRATGDFDAFWRDSLRRGTVQATAATAPQLRIAPLRSVLADAAPAQARGLAAVFARDPSVYDGAFANSSWLQELPQPFTKLTWDNAALIGTPTAQALGLTTGDVVRLSAGRSRIEAPVWVLATHAPDVVTLPLGQGRAQAGRVGNRVGFDAYPLLGVDGTPLAVTLERTGRRHAFAVAQTSMDAHGRELARTIAPGEALPPPAPPPSLYPDAPRGEHAWAMSINLDACIGCNACTIACQAENNIPVVGKEEVARGRHMHWIRVDRYEADLPGASIFQPVPCMHCENAPCEVVCPVGATLHDSEGLNVQVYNRCVGTRFCSNNCPYKVRRFNFLQYSDDQAESLKGQRNPDVTVRERGVMEKCTYCIQRISRARRHAERSGEPIADGDVVTACQSACPTGAIHFGDLNDAGSVVSRLRQSPRHYALLGELNTRPRTTYLARVDAAAGKKTSHT